MAELRAYDPGDVYTGVGYFREAEGPRDPLYKDPHLGPTLRAHGWVCYDAKVLDPDAAEDELGHHLISTNFDVRYVVWERFRLYPDKAQQQSGSEFRTPQGIGAIKWMVRNQNAWRARAGKAPIESHVYGAEAKAPARAILRSKNIRSTAKRVGAGPGTHAVDAELHGWHYILEELKRDAEDR